MSIELPSLRNAGAAPTRTINTFVFPRPISAMGVVIEAINIVELRAAEELRAAKRAGADAMAMAHELTKESIHSFVKDTGDVINVSTGDGTTDALWDAIGSAARSLITQAYTAVNTPAQGDADSFLKSRRARI